MRETVRLGAPRDRLGDLGVDTGGSEQLLPQTDPPPRAGLLEVDVRLAHELAHEGESVRVEPARGDADDHVSGPDALSGDGDSTAGKESERGRAEVGSLDDRGHYRGLSSEQRASGATEPPVESLADCPEDRRVRTTAQDRVNEAGGASAHGRKVVHVHADDILPNLFPASQFLGE